MQLYAGGPERLKQNVIEPTQWLKIINSKPADINIEPGFLGGGRSREIITVYDNTD